MNVAAFVLTIVVNGIAGGTTILGGKLTAEISDAYPTLVTPAGYVFSIWSVIYVLLGVFVIFQALPSQNTIIFIDALVLLGFFTVFVLPAMKLLQRRFV